MPAIHPERWKAQLVARPHRLSRPLFYRQFATTPTRRVAVVKLPSPTQQSILSSAKLYALRARLHLPKALPIQTLARCLVHPTADPDPRFNNSSLATLGSDLLGYYTAEYLLCNFPRLPMTVLFAAQNGYVGPQACADVVRQWGVEAAAEPGGEVDPGFLQFGRIQPGAPSRTDVEVDPTHDTQRRALKRGMGARIVLNDQFGDYGDLLNDSVSTNPPQDWGSSPVTIPDSDIEDTTPQDPALSDIEDSPPQDPALGASFPANGASTDLETAAASFLRALTGAIHLHTSPAQSSSFHQAHILSRHLDLSGLFTFKNPTHDLSRLCAREGFEPPVARLLSETGRHSIAPVYIVGVYSGFDKLGEGAGTSLDEARNKAAANALRGWYLYRPESVVRPSEVDTKAWKPNYVDCGEVVF